MNRINCKRQLVRPCCCDSRPILAPSDSSLLCPAESSLSVTSSDGGANPAFEFVHKRSEARHFGKPLAVALETIERWKPDQEETSEILETQLSIMFFIFFGGDPSKSVHIYNLYNMLTGKSSINGPCSISRYVKKKYDLKSFFSAHQKTAPNMPCT